MIITGRDATKAEAARVTLEERTGRKVFVPLAMDNDRLVSVRSAAATLGEMAVSLDYLILNAGIVAPPKPSFSEDGFERTISSTLLGHHVLVTALLEQGSLGDDARIVIAGSEAATGTVMGFSPTDMQALADDAFDGDVAAAVRAQVKMEPPATYKPGDVYATAKLFVAQWAAELATRLPEGMTVVAVSPGSAPDTNAARNANFFMRTFLIPFFKHMPGMSHSIADGARRYLDGAARGREVTGQFLASPPKKVTGPLRVVDLPEAEPTARAVTWAVTEQLTGSKVPTA